MARFLKIRNRESRFLLPEELWIGKSELESHLLGIGIEPPLVGVDPEVAASKIFPFPVTQASIIAPRIFVSGGDWLELGRFTIQIRDYHSKSHFLMSRESPIQFSIGSIHFSHNLHHNHATLHARLLDFREFESNQYDWLNPCWPIWIMSCDLQNI